MTIRGLRQKMLISLGLGMAVMLGLSIFGDLPSMARTLGSFHWELLVPILLLTFWNYLLRFLKWQYYLGLVGVHGISRRSSLLAFFSGLSMVITPGKIGEWLKCFLVKEVTGTPVSVTAPIVIAERLTDGMAMLLLAAVGLVVYSYAWQVLLAILLATVAFVVVVQWRSLSLRLLAWGEKLPLVSRRMGFLERFYESAYRLLRLDALTLAIAVGILSWFGECVALFLVLVGLGLDPTWTLLLQATFILAASSVIASVAFVPGGLGVAEGSITGMLLVLGVVTGASAEAVAASATILIRFCTLWFGVAVGVLALMLFSREMKLALKDFGQTPDVLAPSPHGSDELG